MATQTEDLGSLFSVAHLSFRERIQKARQGKVEFLFRGKTFLDEELAKFGMEACQH
jgi:hypothetical protein